VVAAVSAADRGNAGDMTAATELLFATFTFTSLLCAYLPARMRVLQRFSRSFADVHFVSPIADPRGAQSFAISPETIYFGGGTHDSAYDSPIGFLLGGFREPAPISISSGVDVDEPGKRVKRKAAFFAKLE